MMYEVAIPSHQRPGTIADTTLPLLTRGGVDPDRITVWVSSDDQREQYEDSCSPFGVHVRSGGWGQGVKHARNGIATAYPAGTRLLQIDDDVRRIVRAADSKTLVDVNDVHALIDYGFDVADQLDLSLWCLYPAANPYFMRPRVRVGLLYAEACVIGMTLRRDETEQVTVDDKEDFERSILHYLRDGGVVRLDGYSFKSNFYTEPGGMQTYRTIDTIEAGARTLTDRYPDLCSYRVSKSRGMPEVKFRRLPTSDHPIRLIH